MADFKWNSRLAVSVTDDTGGTNITPIDSFTPSFALNAEPIHSIEQTHIGVIYSPKSITFSMTVKAIGNAAAKLTGLALSGTPFEILLQEGDGTDWSFSTVVMTECVITSCTPSTASPSGAPSATFSGFSLSSTVTPKAPLTAIGVP